jgi:signal transduction histidine kinase
MNPTVKQRLFAWGGEKLSRFLYPVNVDAEEKAKRLLTGLIVAFTVPLLLGYSIFNFYAHRFTLSVALFLTAILVSASVLAGRKKVDPRNSFRCGLAVVGLLFLYLIVKSEAYPRLLFWSFIFPLEAVYLLGRREGFLFSIAYDVIAVVLVWGHDFRPSVGDHAIHLRMEYALSLLTITLISYCFEMMRFRYQETTKRRQASLAEANERLKAEAARRKAQEKAARDALSQLRETQVQLVQSAKMASMGELVSGVAHELNQPLMVIRANAQLLDRWLKNRTNPGAEPLESLALVEANTKRMMTIINHLRTFSREAKEAFTNFDVNKAIEACRLMMGEQLRLRNIDLKLDLAENLPMISGSEIQLEQVFLNLLTNARDAIEARREGSQAFISISTAVSGNGGNGVEILVSDTGNGIPGKNVDRIFEPFFTTKEVGEGTGLGLSISYGIIKDHEGEIKVARTGSDGTTFQIRLPFLQAAVPE